MKIAKIPKNKNSNGHWWRHGSGSLFKNTISLLQDCLPIWCQQRTAGIEEDAPDLILSDVVMPGKMDTEFCRESKKTYNFATFSNSESPAKLRYRTR